MNSHPQGSPASIPLLLVILFLSFFHGVIPLSSQAQGGPLDPSLSPYPPSSYEGYSQVISAAMDQGDGLWFGTSSHVLHYTGENWEKIPTRPGMPVFAITVDEKDRVWVGGQSEFGFLRPTPSSNIRQGKVDTSIPSETGPSGKSPRPAGKLEYVSLAHQVPDSLENFNIVWDIIPHDGRVFFNARNVMFIYEKGSIRSLHPKEEFFSSHKVKGRLWTIDGNKGIFRLGKMGEEDASSGKIASLQKLPASAQLAKKEIVKILDPSLGRTSEEKKEVLVLTRRNGIFRYRYGPSLKEDEKRVIPLGEAWAPLFRQSELYHATVLSPRNNPWGASIAVSTMKRGGMLLDPKGRPVHILDQKNGMTANLVWNTIKGPPGSGMLWSATNNGITRWTPGDPRTYSLESQEIAGGVKDITRHAGYLFVSTDQGVYFRQKREDQRKNEWKLVSGGEGHHSDLQKTGESSDTGSGTLLVAGKTRLLEIRSQKRQRKKGGNRKWRAYEVIQRNCYDLSTLPRNKRREWTAFGGREGIVFLSRKDGKGWEEELRIKELPEQVISLESARSGEGEPIDLWAGFRRKGGFRARLDSGLFSELLRSDSTYVLTYGELLGDPLDGMNLTPFIGGKGERKGLPPGPISFCPLKDRMLATTDSGLYRIDETAQGEHRWVPDTVLGCLFGKCSARKGKKVKEVFQFWEGEEGSIWVQARQPYHLLPDTDGEYHIDSLPFKGLGLGTIRSIYPDSNGVTWIGGDNGVVRYDEKVPKNFERSYSCMLTEVTTPSKNKGRKKNDSALFAGYYRKPAPNDPLLDWKRSWEQPEAFVPTLPYELNALTFHFAAPYYEKQEKVTYSYFLKGFDERWSEWKKETRKEYTNLPEGTYTFKVKAKNIYGVESSIGEYRFRVLPPWYRTWPAYGGYGIAGIGMVWLLLWLNSRRLVAQKQRLESLVDERTKEIREKNERLETANEEIQAEKEKVEEQKEKVEEAHQEITASIDYAQKIQNALLRSEEYASDHLPEHFILFKPQATVSGDFYWAKERNGHLYLAAIDCTGHGVPGAFMSMLGISQLNEIMAAKEWPSSGEVLTELRERVVAELQSGDPEGGAKDGMDAAMVKIPISGSQNPDPKRIEFAGANNPLYVVKEGIGQDPKGLRVLSGIPEGRLRPFRKSPDGIEIKGDKMAVGYEPDAAEAFTTAELEVPPGAMLYLFSDGYADQFGGPKGKKFRYGPFKELLARIHTMSPEEQKAELDRVFEEWKGGQEQVDDVCVVGVRV